MANKKLTTPVITQSAFHRIEAAAWHQLQELIEVEKRFSKKLKATPRDWKESRREIKSRLASYRRDIRHLYSAMMQMKAVKQSLNHPDKRVVAIYRKAIA